MRTIPTRKETYRILGLKEPLVWERAALEVNLTHGIEPKRRSGTTTMLAVEAALDVLHGKTIWLIGYTITDTDRLVNGLDDTLMKLGAPFGAKRNLVYTETWANFQGSKGRLIGTRPDSIYIDHYIGPTGEEHRPHTGPYGLIRTVKQDAANPDHWTALDYDGDFVMTLDEASALQLRDERPERVRLVPLPAPPIESLQSGYGLNASATGVSYGPPLKAVSTKNVPITSNMVTGVENAMFDGVCVEVGDSVLLLVQEDTVENGVWEVTSSGDGGMLVILPSPSPADGTTHVVIGGLLYADTLWTYTGSYWAQTITAPSLSLSDGYGGSGALVVTGTSIEIGTSGGLSMQSTQNSEWTARNGDQMRRVTLPDGSVMLYRNGLLESVDGAEDIPVDPDDPSLLINILADSD